MNFPTALLRDLLELSTNLDDGDELDVRLAGLGVALKAAVPSYRGLCLTVHDAGQPVSLTWFLPRVGEDEITTSLRLPFTALSPDLDSHSGVIFYAATRGAFVDLAADLGHALAAPIVFDGSGTHRHESPDGDGWHGDRDHDGDDGHHRDGRGDGDGYQHRAGSIVVDADLPPQTLVSRLAGLAEVSAINRAIGMLIEQGHHPDDAAATLRRQAAAVGVDPHVYASRLLGRVE